MNWRVHPKSSVFYLPSYKASWLVKIIKGGLGIPLLFALLSVPICVFQVLKPLLNFLRVILIRARIPP